MQRQPKRALPADKNELETPWDFFNGWDAQYKFTIDVAASAENAKCDLYLTKKQNALNLPWGHHRAWMNCPYSRGELWKWTRHAMHQAKGGALVCGLVPASTDTQWWHRHVWSVQDAGVPMGFEWDNDSQIETRNWLDLRVSVYFVEGRITFEYLGKPSIYGSGKFASAIIVWEPGGGYVWPGESSSTPS